jgi:hypothetical protein
MKGIIVMRAVVWSSTSAVLAALAVGCVSSELKVGKNDPAHPGGASPAPVSRSGVLSGDYDPLAAPAASGEKKPPADAGAQKYTCPMHPEIVKDEPGLCPICNMKLVPVKAKPHSHAGEH